MALPGIPVSEFDTLEHASANTEHERVRVTIQPLPYQPGFEPKQAAPTTATVREKSEGEMPDYPYGPVSGILPVPLSLEGQETSEDSRKTGDNERIGSETPQPRFLVDEAATEEKFVFPPPPPLSRPPPQVMTVLGPMPLPPEIRRRIPEKFVAKPIIEEREIYVAKKEVRERTVEIPHVQYEHKFANVPKALSVNRLLPIRKEIVKEIPREVYKPVIEEKVIEVPQGVKYVEVPVEVPCVYPPKIVPVPKTQYVERVVETIKPIVKERLIEIPQTVVKQIPKIKTVEVPYYVSRYVEKVVEVPYQPPASGALPHTVEHLPFSVSNVMPPGPVSMQGSSFPPSFAGAPVPPVQPFTLGPMPLSELNEIKLPYEAKIEVKVTQPEFFTGPGDTLQGGQGLMSDSGGCTWPGGQGGGFSSFAGQGIGPNVVPRGAWPGQPIPGSPGDGSGEFTPPSFVDLPIGYSWGRPSNVPQPSPPCLAPPTAAPLKQPIMVTCPPEVGKVNFGGYLMDPEILTRQGVVPYGGFRVKGTVNQLFPPLPSHPNVPMKEPGTPDIATIDETTGARQYVETHPNWEAEETEAMRAERSQCFSCASDCLQG